MSVDTVLFLLLLLGDECAAGQRRLDCGHDYGRSNTMASSELYFVNEKTLVATGTSCHDRELHRSDDGFGHPLFGLVNRRTVLHTLHVQACVPD